MTVISVPRRMQSRILLYLGQRSSFVVSMGCLPSARIDLRPVEPSWCMSPMRRALRRPLFGTIGLPKGDTDPVLWKFDQRIHHGAGTLEYANARYRDPNGYTT